MRETRGTMSIYYKDLGSDILEIIKENDVLLLKKVLSEHRINLAASIVGIETPDYLLVNGKD